MIRNLKALGLALVAVCAMSAFAASAAQATAGSFSWDSGTTKLDANGVGEQIFELTAGTVKCNTVTGSTKVSGTGAESVTSETITYTDAGKEDKCRGPFGTEPKIEMNGCQYRFNAGTTVASAPNGHTTGTVDIVNCTNVDKSITVNAPGCIVHIQEQNGLGPVTYKTAKNGSFEDVTVEAAVTNIKYTHTGFLCSNGSATNGKYTGNATITGTNAGGTATNATVT
jgi:hypothetical protein